MKNVEMVREFQIAFGHPVLEPGETPLYERMKLRLSFIQEEMKELFDEIKNPGKRSALAKELADLEYVIIGMALEAGVAEYVCQPYGGELRNTPISQLMDWMDGTAKYLKDRSNLRFLFCATKMLGKMLDLDQDSGKVFGLVHASNMSKLGPNGKPIYNDVGKVMKGPNYCPPDLTWIDEG